MQCKADMWKQSLQPLEKKNNKKNRHHDNFSWDLFHIFATFLFTQI